uniref:Uncharacterized protein n=1 Tax=Romanomermis culicivorax TaxID=13658 RepID=A0A915JBV9_ROMCU
MNLTAFFRNRFYEIDRWYKARIEKPEILPQCYFIDPDNHYKSLAERLEELDLEKNQNRQLIDIGPFFDEKNLKISSNTKDTDATELERLARLRKCL